MYELVSILLMMGIFGINFEYANMNYILNHSLSTREKRLDNQNNQLSDPSKNFLVEPLPYFPRELNKFYSSFQLFYPELNNIDDNLNRITINQFSKGKNTKKGKNAKEISKRSRIKNKKTRIDATDNFKKSQKSSKRTEMFIVDETQLDDSQSTEESQLDDQNDEYDNEESDNENNGYFSEKDADTSDISQKYKPFAAVNSYAEADDNSNPKEQVYPQFTVSSKQPSVINGEPMRDVMFEGLSTPYMESNQLIKANQMRGNYISVGNGGNKNLNPFDESAAALDNIINKEASKVQIDNSIKQKIFEDIAKDAALRDEYSKNMTEFDLDEVEYDESKKQKNNNKDALFSSKIPTSGGHILTSGGQITTSNGQITTSNGQITTSDGQILGKEQNFLNDLQKTKMQVSQEKPGYSYLVLPKNSANAKVAEDIGRPKVNHDKQAKVVTDADSKNEPAAVGDFANIVEKADEEVINSSLKFQKPEKHKETVDKIFEEQHGVHLKTIFSPTFSQLSSQDAFFQPQPGPFSLEASPSVNDKFSISKIHLKQEMDPFSSLKNPNLLGNPEDDKKIQNLEPPTKIFVPSKDTLDIHSITPTDQLLEMLSKGQFNNPMSDDELTKLSSFDPNKQYLDDQSLNPTQFSQNNIAHFGATYFPSNGINQIESLKMPFNEKHLENSNSNAPIVVKTDPAFLGQNIHLLDPTKYRTFDDLNKISEGMIHAHVVSIKQPTQNQYPIEHYIHLPHIVTPFPTPTIQRIFEDALITSFNEKEHQNSFHMSNLLKYGKAISNNHCHTSPCQNGGLCTPHPHGFRCSCKLGWIGEMCNKRSSCTPNPCVHGSCSPNTDGHTCTCKKGFKGQQCQEVDRCYPNPCSNNGICAETMHKVQCECLPGFKGSFCQLEAKCAPVNPCLNGGVCREFFAHYHCQCASLFYGQNCEALLVPTKPPATLIPKYSGPQAIPMPFGSSNLYPLHSEAFESLLHWESSNKKAFQVIDKKPKKYPDEKVTDYDALNKSSHNSTINTYNNDNKKPEYNRNNEMNNLSVPFNHKIVDSSFFEKMSLLLGGKVPRPLNGNKTTKNYTSKGIGKEFNNTMKMSSKKEEKAKVRTIKDMYNDKNIFLKNKFSVDVYKSNQNMVDDKNAKKIINKTRLMIEDSNPNLDSTNEAEEENLKINNVHPSGLAERLKILDKRVFKGLLSNNQLSSNFLVDGFNQHAKITFQENGKQRSVVNRKPKVNYPPHKNVGQSRTVNLLKDSKTQFQPHKHVIKNSFKTLNKYGCPSFCGYICDPWCIKVGCCKANSDQINLYREIEKEHFRFSQNKQARAISKACLKCNENADCLVNRCVCKTGFHGNGIVCKVDICVLCHLDADCFHQKCFCKNGFLGDGYNCKPRPYWIMSI